MASTLDQRNSQLDALQDAVKQYAQAQRDELNRRVAVNKQILLGRTGSDRLANSSVESTSSLVVETINSFLTGA